MGKRNCRKCLWFEICQEEKICDNYTPTYEEEDSWDEMSFRSNWGRYIEDFCRIEEGLV